MPRRVLFLGMTGILSLTPLRALLQAGADVVGVILPDSDRRAPIRPLRPDPAPETQLPLGMSPVQPDIRHEAWQRQIPVMQVGDLGAPETITAVARLAPDLICVSCFSRILPPAWLAIPPLGSLNLHPSLLPAFRGPAPIFWQFRAGETRFGVTLHFLDKAIDTGDIVSQTQVEMPDGVRTTEAERRLAEAGAQLLAHSLQLPALPRRPQPQSNAGYQSFPTPDDRVIPHRWPARRAFNFMRGAEHWGPFLIRTSDGLVHARQALSLQPEEQLGVAYCQEGGLLHVQFQSGVITITGSSATRSAT